MAGSGFQRFRGFFQSIAKIAFGRLAAKRFIWVRHNLEPHNGEKKSKLYRLVLWILEKTSEIKCSHAEYMDGYHYIPHPLYASSAASCSQLERDKKFVYFGHIARYKKLDELLNSWPVEEKLELHGKCYDTQLADELRKIIELRKLQVITCFEFLTEVQLEDLLLRTQYLILPHGAGSMIVSGAFYHAISFGTNILISDNLFGQELARRHPFCHSYQAATLPMVTQNLHYILPEDVINAANNFYGDEPFKQRWSELFTAAGQKQAL